MSARRTAGLALFALALGASVLAQPAPAPKPAAPKPSAPPRPATAPKPARAPVAYLVTFEARIAPTERAAHVAVRLGEGAHLLRWVELDIDPARHTDFHGDGKVDVSGGHVRWEPPARGGVLRYTFRIDALRNRSAYESRCAEDWALFRGDDLFPPARVRGLRYAYSRSTLRLRVPEGWKIAVPYERLADGGYRVENPLRHFDRPVGWFALGKIGVLRERIAGAHVAVAGPIGQGLRRQDILAMLRWTLPRLRQILGVLPERLLVVGAGDPMWRGGLSGPSSLFIHADRPLITPDLTSPLLHELIHAVTNARAGPDGDWIVEGLAEYYGLELLVRSHSVSRLRHQKALAAIEQRGRGATLSGAASSGPSTARAVAVLHSLDELIRQKSADRKNLDSVLAALARQDEPITTAGFRTLAERLSGIDLEAFFRSEVGRVR